jgi:hypothetical protein
VRRYANRVLCDSGRGSFEERQAGPETVLREPHHRGKAPLAQAKRGWRPPSQGWKTFIRNHADGIASMDLFVVPTLSFRLLYSLVILWLMKLIALSIR